MKWGKVAPGNAVRGGGGTKGARKATSSERVVCLEGWVHQEGMLTLHVGTEQRSCQHRATHRASKGESPRQLGSLPSPPVMPRPQETERQQEHTAGAASPSCIPACTADTCPCKFSRNIPQIGNALLTGPLTNLRESKSYGAV